MNIWSETEANYHEHTLIWENTANWTLQNASNPISIVWDSRFLKPVLTTAKNWSNEFLPLQH